MLDLSHHLGQSVTASFVRLASIAVSAGSAGVMTELSISYCFDKSCSCF
jgi:hypothetical protein